jgi:hypothetical protein
VAAATRGRDREQQQYGDRGAFTTIARAAFQPKVASMKTLPHWQAEGTARSGNCRRSDCRARLYPWPSPKERAMTKTQFQSCIEACTECAVTCHHCAAACLQEPDVKMMARCIALDMDCAAICELAAAAMARGSSYAQDICRLCADICEACGDECGKHEAEHCKRCAEACRRCADECRRMSGAGGQGVSIEGQAGRAH